MINNRLRRIHLKKVGESAYEEGRAGATITPGMLISINNANTYVPHPTAASPAEAIFAIEDALSGIPGQGGKTIDNNYASGDLVRMVIPQRGDHVLGILQQGQNVQLGAHLVSAGDGTLKAAATASVEYIGTAMEDRNASGTAASLEARRLSVRIR